MLKPQHSYTLAFLCVLIFLLKATVCFVLELNIYAFSHFPRWVTQQADKTSLRAQASLQGTH